MNFPQTFKALTGNSPFPWQESLYQRFIDNNIPSSCNLPTGLGKTSVVAIWLIALAEYPDRVPRRLAYVVNRRTVVDQTTSEVENYRSRLQTDDSLKIIRDKLSTLCASVLDENGDPQRDAAGEPVSPLALSTLRGQFADNREWSADPSRAAVIVGTVDMIGSRLLFSGYGVGFKGRPLHAGFLGQDTLLVHDEAHLEPAFQTLLESVEAEQKRCSEFRKLTVMELSATSRGQRKPFELTVEEKNPPPVPPNPPSQPLHFVWQRLKAKKGLKLESVKRSEITKKIGESARQWKTSGKAILVFVRSIEDVGIVYQILTDKKEGVRHDQVQLLTGTMRGLERDEMVGKAVFKRFLPTAQADGPTVYLVCTSAGEVGIDISADHMVCDLSTLDSMAQRLGRVNRRGEGAAEITIFYEGDPDPKQQDNPFEIARWNTLKMLWRLQECDWIKGRLDGSPLSLRSLLHSENCERVEQLEADRKAAFAPPPTILPASDILFDAWALTTLRDRLPGRPPVEPYLHGVSEWVIPETHVAWRQEVRIIIGNLLVLYPPKDLLEDYPLKPHELLRDNSSRVFDRLKKLSVADETPVWLVSDDGSVVVTSLKEIIDAGKERLSFLTVLLPPEVGGLDGGMLSANSTSGNDVADEWYIEGLRCRVRVWDDDPRLIEIRKSMRLIRTIDTRPDDDESETDINDAFDDLSEHKLWFYYEMPSSGDSDGSKASVQPITWQHHTNDVIQHAQRTVEKLPLDEDLRAAILIAAKFHDLGKLRAIWQRDIGNDNYPLCKLAKSGGKLKIRNLGNPYRHEFGSLVDLLDPKQPHFEEFKNLSADLRDVVLHLIAVHHGFGRPHFSADYVFDPEPKGVKVEQLAIEIPQRFARMQRKYGRWGLAYLESLLRAADYAASADPTQSKSVVEETL